MKKIALFQFEPIIGGESTLCACLSKILSKHYTVRIFHPCGYEGTNMRVSQLWKAVDNGKFVPYYKVPEICNVVDYCIFLNSVHINQKTYYEQMFPVIRMFSNIKNSNVIFYEHGLHTWNHCDYETIFSMLNEKNKIRILTNTNEAIEKYTERGYKSFLCRQPFIEENYPIIQKNKSKTVNICFNSRFSTAKFVHKAIDYFSEFLNDEAMDFKLQFRASGKEPDGMNVLKDEIRKSKNGILKDYAVNISEIYDNQDFCLYWGYDETPEIGKLEYSLLEAFYYEIPVIAHPSWIRSFKCEEYGYTQAFIDSCFIPLDPYTIIDLVKNPEKYKSCLENARLLLCDFLEYNIIERIKLCFNSLDI